MDRWVYLLTNWRVCDGCGRSERFVKKTSEFKGEDGKMRSKTSGTWVSAKKDNPEHGESCIESSYRKQNGSKSTVGTK